MFKSFFGFLFYPLNYLCAFLILTIRPLLGPATCRYSFTCTDFALEELQHKSFFSAFSSIFFRVLSCNPFTK